MTSPDTQSPADHLLVLVDCPESDHKNWSGFLETLRAIQGRVSNIVAAQNELDGWLIRGVGDLIGRFEERNLPPVKGALMRGLIGDYPIFAALAIQPAPGLEGVSRTLQAHYLVGMAAREKFKGKDGSNQYIANAGLGVRKFARNDFGHDAAVARLAEAEELGQLYRLVENLLDAPESDAQSQSELGFRSALGYLKPFLHYIDEDIPSPSKTPSEQTRATADTKESTEFTAETEGFVASGVKSSRISSKGLSIKRQREYQAEASSPKVETTTDVLFQSEISEKFPTGKIKQLTERQIHARARIRAASVKSSLQPTASKRSTLHFPALKILAEINFDPNAPEEVQKSDILIAMMFLTGCRPEDVHGFRIWQSNKPEFAANPFAIIIDSEEFRVPIRPLIQAWQPEKAEEKYYRPVETHFHVKVPTYLPVGRAILEFAHQRKRGNVAFEWPEDPKELRQLVAGRLSKLSRAGHIYLYPERVSQYLGKAVYALEGDMADANLLTGSRADKDDSRSYYHAPPVSHLQECYNTVWRLIARRRAGKPEARPAPLMGSKGSEGPYVGSAGVPDSAHVREMNRDLLQVIHDRSVGLRNAQWRRENHNSITATLYLQILWMTGIRPVRDVIEYRQYDPETGFMAVDDKDNEEESKVRLVWLIPALQEQLRLYDSHLKSLVHHLDLHDPYNLAFRFFSSSSKRLIKYTKKTFVANLGIDYVFRENAHRHYIRTRLRELGVDGAYVDALLGHGGIGREAYGHYSALSPGAMRDAIKEPLQVIWRELGFGPVL